MEESRRTVAAPLCSGSSDELTASSFDSSMEVLHHSVNVRPDDCARWTNEKHNLYLDILEASFVKQLFQSSPHQRCSQWDEKERNLTEEPAASEKKCLQANGTVSVEFATRSELLHAKRSDLHSSVGNITDTQTPGFAEGSGQNFEDGCEGNTSSKRRKTAARDISSHDVNDQVVPSGMFDSPTIASSTPKRGERVSRECCLLKKYESFVCPKTDVT